MGFDPDDSQMDVIMRGPGERVLVTAGPGSGKTFTLVKRVARLVASGIRPSEMLVMSFTRAAVTEVAGRIRGDCEGVSEEDTARMVRTFDSWATALLRDGGGYGADVLDEMDYGVNMPYGTYDPIELIGRVERRVGGDTVTALVSMLGRLGTLDLLVQALDLDETDERGTRTRKVLVMGASRASVDELRSITCKAGFDQAWFEYRLDYKKLDRRSIGRLRNSSYSAVKVGPMPHSVRGKGDASSAIQRMKDHPESYPPVIEARDSNGLKITNNSFRAALRELDELFAACRWQDVGIARVAVLPSTWNI